jgi:hypothetical protein
MKLNLGKIRRISFTMKTNILNYRHDLGNCLISRNYFIKNRNLQIDCKLYFHHVDLFSHEINLLRLIPKMTFSFSTVDSLLKLYFVWSHLRLGMVVLLRLGRAIA